MGTAGEACDELVLSALRSCSAATVAVGVGVRLGARGSEGYKNAARSLTGVMHGKNEHTPMHRRDRDFEDSDFSIEWLRPAREPGRSARKVWALIGLVAAPALAAGLLHLLR